MNISAELVAIAIGVAYPWSALDGRSHPISDVS